ncbi:MAG: hypothetical protein ACT4N8_07450 [Sphingosinicella sp.]|uniref:hypothetical protein n=1 Tax=Sphingosinicella sp. TaxID=1917971 RepID=UPI0040379EDA
MRSGLALACSLLLGAAPAAAQPASEAQLRELVAALVEQARALVPRPLDNERIWTGVRADGVEVIYDITLNRDLTADEIAALRRVQDASDPIAMCADHTISYLVGLGARLRQIYTDAGGDRFETVVASCPAA